MNPHLRQVMDTADVGRKFIYHPRLGGWIPRPLRIKSIQRNMLQYFMDEPAWAFAGQKSEYERLRNMLKRAGIVVDTFRYGGEVIINITIKI